MPSKRSVKWRDMAPTRKERRSMKSKCFLEPKTKKYPVCPRRSERVSCKGVRAAELRARLQRNQRVMRKAKSMKKRCSKP